MRRSFPIVVLLLGLPASALAADFTFRVPVRISNAPSVTSVRVDCAVSRSDPSGLVSMAGADLVGTGFTVQPIAGGTFSDVVVVEVNATGIRTPDQGRAYSCSLSANGAARTGVTYTASPGNMREAYETATATTLASFTSTVRGAIPR